jgi:hypothetical protein
MLCLQGASPEEVQQLLYQSATRGSVTDDPQGFGTMWPNINPNMLDVSSTPNRLLTNNLKAQVGCCRQCFCGAEQQQQGLWAV